MTKFGPLHIIAATSKPVTGTVICLHGSGDTGQGFLNWIQFLINDFSLPHVRFLFPTAPLRPYTPLDGELSNVWFDREAIRPDVREDKATLDSAQSEIIDLIQNEVNSGIPLNRIIIGGFSMGGALALHTAYRFQTGLAGVYALSSFLNVDSAVYHNLKTGGPTVAVGTPLYMCHGDRDTLVPLDWGRQTFVELQKLGVHGEFNIIRNTLHEIKRDELNNLFKWIQKILPSIAHM